MVRNPRILKEFEENLVGKSKPDYHKNVKIVNALLQHARKMGKFPPKNRLEDIELDIRYARAINSVR